ncbi:NAD-dependent dehydratase [Kocuria polaris]|nr:NAD-dependent dehydratase [Kocuria polaris]
MVIAGGTGFLGRQLAADLMCRGHDVVLLTRNPEPTLPFRQAVWDGRSVAEWAGELDAAPGQRVAVVNLAGKLVDVRPTAENIAALRSSRVDSTTALVEASRGLENPVSAWVQASTTAIFGDAGEDLLTEDSALPTGTPALPQMTGVAEPWEAAAAGAHSERLHLLRTSIVLEQECPAFDRLAMLARAGLGGTVGDGRQWFSWIHLADWLSIVRGLLGLTPGLDVPAGVVNAAAPEPVRNRELMRILRGALAPQPLKRRSLNTPAPLLNVGAVALRTDPALGLTGRHVTSRVLADAGFTFRYPDLPGAISEIVS